MKKLYLFITSSLLLLSSCLSIIDSPIEKNFFGCWIDEQKREICIGQKEPSDPKLESRSYEGKDSSNETNSLKGIGEFETIEKDNILMIYLKERDGNNINERRCAKYKLYSNGTMELSKFIVTTNDTCNLTKEEEKTTKWTKN